MRKVAALDLAGIVSLRRTGGVATQETNTNNNASAGNVGEFISSNVASGSAVALTTGTAADVTSISLTAGDWDVEGMVTFTTTATSSISTVSAYISSASGTLPTAPNNTAPYGHIGARRV
ncbi:hypothetical protein ABIB82_003924 [Bradyrhizobium sp. i1.8.4]|uniref:hypothetical protein n=1 Tax=unclassified Bradyrhizobium TaxID=2631580 RepID=UPI003D1D978B